MDHPEIDRDTFTYFLAEADDYLDALERGFLALRTSGREPRQLFELFRAAHTLKGSSATVGLDGFAGLVHHLEDGVRALQDERLLLDATLEEQLLAAVDALRLVLSEVRSAPDSRESASVLAQARQPFTCLSSFLEGYSGGEPLSAEVYSDTDPMLLAFDGDCGQLLASFEARLAAGGDGLAEALAELLNLVEGLGQLFDLEGLGRVCQAARAAAERRVVDSEFAALVLAELRRAQALVLLGQSGAVAPSARLLNEEEVPAAAVPLLPRSELLRVEAARLDTIDSLASELVVDRTNIEAHHDRLLAVARQLRRYGWQFRRLTGGLQELSTRLLLEKNGAEAGFDSLELDRYGAATTLLADIQELLSRIDEQSADVAYLVERARENSDILKQNLEQLRENVAAVRLQSFSQVSDRLPRAVRDLAQRYGKPVQLVVEGEDTLLDRIVLNQLSDPLLHLVRNAFAHGIETPEERLRSGKPPEGQICVRAVASGHQVEVQVSDDGRGIDASALLAAARRQGLSVSEPLNEATMLAILCTSGFSTAQSVGELAGRGVGLDAVRSRLEQVGGRLELRTQSGVGTTFSMRLPLNQSILNLLVFEVSGRPFAFPTGSIAELGESAPEAMRLEALLGAGAGLRGSGGAFLNVLGLAQPVEVDRIVGEAELVLKPFPPPFSHCEPYLGCAILADGRLAPVIDAAALTQRSPEVAVAPAETLAIPILVVEDSVALRHTLAGSLRRFGYPVETARDGQEALEKLREGLACRLVLSDIEMPRLNGFELLAQMQSDARLAQVPLIYLTSRSGEKHRQLAGRLGAAGFLNKPYLESDLKRLLAEVLSAKEPVAAMQTL